MTVARRRAGRKWWRRYWLLFAWINVFFVAVEMFAGDWSQAFRSFGAASAFFYIAILLRRLEVWLRVIECAAVAPVTVSR